MVTTERNINPYQMQAWVHTLQKRMSNFLEKEAENIGYQERIDFIRHQYSLIDVGISVIDGRSILVGCSCEEE